MTKFIKLHRRRPRIKKEYIGQRFGVTKYQDGWYDDRIDDIFINIELILSFSDYKVNDIDVCETADEILQELER